MNKTKRKLLELLLLEDNDTTETTNTNSTCEFGGSKTKIVVLQRGWIVVGKFQIDGNYITLTDAKCIRKWGTSKGLGELAMNGATSETTFDPQPDTRFHVLTTIEIIDCNDSKWN